MFYRYICIVLMVCWHSLAQAEINDIKIKTDVLKAFGNELNTIPSAKERTAYIYKNYKKISYQIPMRDGIKLYTHIYLPKNSSTDNPIILTRTPYSIWPYKDGVLKAPNLGPSWHFVRENYIIVEQDARGRVMSEGDFEIMRPIIKHKQSSNDVDESTDAYDTIDWLLKNIPGHNGRVGIQGNSYGGFYATMSLVNSHPALKAVSPQAPMSDLFMGDDGHHFGALYLDHAFSYIGKMGRPRKEPNMQRPKPFPFKSQDNYDYLLKLGSLKHIDEVFHKGTNKFWSQMMEHDTYDEFWQERSVYHNLFDVKPAVLVVGGWHDAEDLLGTLDTYKAIEKQNPNIDNTLVMGPWSHTQWKDLGNTSLGLFDYGGAIGEYFQAEMQLKFFNHYLKAASSTRSEKLPEASIFETGTNQWRYYDSWPPKMAERKNFYLQNNGKLSMTNPVGGATSFDEYISDPANPVPYTKNIGNEVLEEYMVEDQRFAARRPDVLVFETEPMTEDTTFSGPITVDFYVSTSGTDSDWVVKVIDVFPDDEKTPKNVAAGVKMGGYQQMIRGEIFRGKFRNSFENPEPFEPNVVTQVKFDLPDVQHNFKKGHKIMIQVQSSWFPLFDRNPQTFMNINKAQDSDFKKATQRVYYSREYPSNITVGVIQR